jgi:hypothetical protein
MTHLLSLNSCTVNRLTGTCLATLFLLHAQFDFICNCRIYYQLSDAATVPQSCQSLNPAAMTADATCFSHLSSSNWNKLNAKCALSYDNVCNTVYTDNPPYACVLTLSPGFIELASNSFAGTQFVYSIFSVVALGLFTVVVPKLADLCCPSKKKHLAITPETDHHVVLVEDQKNHSDVEMQRLKGTTDQVVAF